MKDLVTIQNRQAITTSLKVAEVFEKKHKDVLEKIRFLAAEISATKLDDGYSPSFLETNYKDERGKIYPLYLMNRDGFTELVGNMNGVKAREWKRKYFAAFNKMEQKLIELELERRNAEYLEVRNATKHSFTKLTDAIKENVIPIMEREGASESGKKFVYKNYVDALQKSFGIAKGTRDKLPIGLLYELDKGQSIASVVIQGLTSAGKTSKEIYSGTKAKLNDYAKLSFINERFLSVQ